MWISLFSITAAVAIALSVAAMMIQGAGGRESVHN